MDIKVAVLIFLFLSFFPLIANSDLADEGSAIGIVGAMEREIEPFLLRMDVTRSYAHEDLTLWEGALNGKKVVLAECDVGQESASESISFLVNNYRIEALIFSGVGGSTELGIDVGDVVVASDFLSINPFEIYSSDAHLASLALSNSFDFDVHYGRFYTTTPLLIDEFILYPYLRVRDVRCVEMENFPMAQMAAEKGIPFLSVRGISDQILLGPLMLLQYRRHSDLAAEHAAAVVSELIADL